MTRLSRATRRVHVLHHMYSSQTLMFHPIHEAFAILSPDPNGFASLMTRTHSVAFSLYSYTAAHGSPVPYRKSGSLIVTHYRSSVLSTISNSTRNISNHLPSLGFIVIDIRVYSPVLEVADELVKSRCEEGAERGTQPVDPVVRREGTEDDADAKGAPVYVVALRGCS